MRGPDRSLAVFRVEPETLDFRSQGRRPLGQRRHRVEPAELAAGPLAQSLLSARWATSISYRLGRAGRFVAAPSLEGASMGDRLTMLIGGLIRGYGHVLLRSGTRPLSARAHRAQARAPEPRVAPRCTHRRTRRVQPRARYRSHAALDVDAGDGRRGGARSARAGVPRARRQPPGVDTRRSAERRRRAQRPDSRRGTFAAARLRRARARRQAGSRRARSARGAGQRSGAAGRVAARRCAARAVRAKSLVSGRARRRRSGRGSRARLERAAARTSTPSSRRAR